MIKDYTYLKPGDLITAYHKGIWEVVSVERRYYTETLLLGTKDKNLGDEYSPLIHYKSVLDSKFRPAKNQKPQSCDIQYCTKIDDRYCMEQIKNCLEQIAVLKALMEGRNDGTR